MSKNNARLLGILSILLIVGWSFVTAPSMDEFTDHFFKTLVGVLNLLPYILGGLLIFFIGRAVWQFPKRRKLHKLAKEYNANLDPVPFIKGLLSFGYDPASTNSIAKVVSINLADGYWTNGEFQKAIETLEKIPLNEADSSDDVNIKIIVRGRLCQFYLLSGKAEKAREQLRLLKSYANNINSLFIAFNKAIIRQNHFMLINICSALFDMEEGAKLSEPLDFFLHQFEHSQQKIAKVFFAYYIANIYEKMGKKKLDEQREYLQYCADNGNMLYQARSARDRLLSL